MREYSLAYAMAMKQKALTGVFPVSTIPLTRYERHLSRKKEHPVRETVLHPLYSVFKKHYDAQAQVAQSMRSLQELYKNTSTLMYEIRSNENRDLIHANKAFRDALGVDESNQDALQLKDVITGKDSDKAQLFERLQAHQRKDEKIPFTLEVINQKTNETKMIAFEEVRLTLPCGESVYFGIAKDITELVALREKEAQLDAGRLIVGRMTHELNNVLGVVMIGVSAALRRLDKGDANIFSLLQAASRGCTDMAARIKRISDQIKIVGIIEVENPGADHIMMKLTPPAQDGSSGNGKIEKAEVVQKTPETSA